MVELKQLQKQLEAKDVEKAKAEQVGYDAGVVGLFWLNRAGLPPTILGPNILSKGVETGPTATQFGPACTQTMPRLPGARLQRAELFQMSYGRQI